MEKLTHQSLLVGLESSTGLAAQMYMTFMKMLVKAIEEFKSNLVILTTRMASRWDKNIGIK